MFLSFPAFPARSLQISLGAQMGRHPHSSVVHCRPRHFFHTIKAVLYSCGPLGSRDKSLPPSGMRGPGEQAAVVVVAANSHCEVTALKTEVPDT